MATERAFVIVGASLAGAKAAQTLREEGFSGRVVLIGEEAERPYERPPLSKSYLLDKEDKAKLYVHDEDWYRENSVELRLGRRVTTLDRDAHQVELAGGDRVGYRKLLLATGAAACQLDLPGADLDGVCYLRRIEDSERLREAIRSGGRVVVVGAGWIGLETAAAAREYGCEVTIIEPQPTPLQAALGPGAGASVIGGFFAQVHRQHGVDVQLGTAVTNAVNPLYHTRIRVEHWANALHGGPAAARSMLGQQVSYDRTPYFFTDQYDIGMEFAGWFPPGRYDGLVTRGDLPARAFYAFWLVKDRVVAGMHINQWDDGIAPVEDLIRRGVPIDRDRLADPTVPLADATTS